MEKVADWLPPRKEREPVWAARGTAMLRARFRRLAVFMVLEIFFAVACLFTGQPAVIILGPVIAAYGGYCGFAAERRAQAARRTGWRKAAMTLARVRPKGTWAS